MRIGIDTSGKFSTDLAEFAPTVVAAAVASDAACREIEKWTQDAVTRWGYGESLRELHAQKMPMKHTREVCEMVAQRGDVRLAAVVTDPGMLGAPGAISTHRRRQREKAAAMRVQTKQGEELKEKILKQLDGDALRDHEYLLSVCLPMVLTLAAQRAIAFFADDASRPDMERFVVRINQESKPTVRYGGGTLFPVLSGDARFSIRTPRHWADDPVHPMLARIMDPVDGGLWLTELFDDVDWTDSNSEPVIQIADVAAWVLARRMKNPGEPKAQACFEPLAELFAGEGGRNFEFFSIAPVGEHQAAMYAHLQQGQQPIWWLRPDAVPVG